MSQILAVLAQLEMRHQGVFMLQALISKQECIALQQQLEQQAEAHCREGSDLARMAGKIQGLEFDLGNTRQSLQVPPQNYSTLCVRPLTS